MAFRTDPPDLTPAQGYKRAIALARLIKSDSATHRANMSSSLEKRHDVVLLFAELVEAKTEFAAIQAINGIVGYARDQQDDQAYDVAAEFTAMIAAIDTVIQRISTDMPTDASNWIQSLKFNGTGDDFDDTTTFTSAQTTQIQADLAALEAAID